MHRTSSGVAPVGSPRALCPRTLRRPAPLRASPSGLDLTFRREPHARLASGLLAAARERVSTQPAAVAAVVLDGNNLPVRARPAMPRRSCRTRLADWLCYGSRARSEPRCVQAGYHPQGYRWASGSCRAGLPGPSGGCAGLSPTEIGGALGRAESVDCAAPAAGKRGNTNGASTPVMRVYLESQLWRLVWRSALAYALTRHLHAVGESDEQAAGPAQTRKRTRQDLVRLQRPSPAALKQLSISSKQLYPAKGALQRVRRCVSTADALRPDSCRDVACR